MLLRKDVHQAFSKELTLWVDPANVDQYVGKNVPFVAATKKLLRPYRKPRLKVQKWITQYSPFIISPSQYAKAQPVIVQEKYQKISDFLKATDYRATTWYRSLKLCIEQRGVAFYKNKPLRSVRDLDAFFEEYVSNLINSLKETGYDPRQGGGIGNVNIGPNGELHKSNAANHRFIICKIIGVAPIPLRVTAVHKAWAEANEIKPNRRAIMNLIEKIRAIEFDNR